MNSLRTCIGCRTKTSPDKLLRTVKSSNGELILGRHSPGRGAWLCIQSEICLQIAVKRKAFNKAFRCQVSNNEVQQLVKKIEDIKS